MNAMTKTEADTNDTLAPLTPAANDDARAYARWRLAVERAALAGGYWDRIFALRSMEEGGKIHTLSSETTRIARR